MSTTEQLPAAASLTVLVGTLARVPERRELPSGETVLELEVAIRVGAAPLEKVNVSWYGAPAAAERWPVGEPVLVTGRTRRRFFSVGGQAQGRTEVVAALALPTRRGTAARAALEAAAAEVLGALDP